ncbi:pantothenate kinase isoform 1 [Gracilaria domingensis]|nr:pantothenate kinase isoform 1 [Gracilaria domingensis]
MPQSPTQSHSSQPELVKVDTALTVLAQINLLEESNALALDIGGSLAKLIYLQPHTSHKPNPPPLKIHQVDGTVANALSVPVPVLNGTLHFFAFESRNIHQMLRFIRHNWPHHIYRRYIRATGGGSYKYEEAFRDEIGVLLTRLDEMTSTVAGLNFLLSHVENEVYFYAPPQPERAPLPQNIPQSTRTFVPVNKNPFPYLLVNIGSGVSIVKVTDHGKFERVSGSALGGGTFWGLARMLLDCQTFDQVIDLTHEGDNRNVDMLVGDIYGGSYENIGLDASVIAASFGKATMRKEYTRHQLSTWSLVKDRFRRATWGTIDLWLSFFHAVPVLGRILKSFGIGNDVPWSPTLITHTGAQYRPQDIALSLLRMVSYNIGQIAYLNARVHNLDTIYFGGNFIRNHPYTIADISFAVDFWSGGNMKALFLKHDGYLGAIGALIGASSASPRKIFDESSPHVTNSKHTEQAPAEQISIPNSQSTPNASSIVSNEDVPIDDGTGVTRQVPGHDSKPEQMSSAQTKAHGDGDHAIQPENAKSSRRKRKKNSKGQTSMPIVPAEILNGSFTAADDQESGGEWTTVTRIRRKAAAKDKAV